MRLFGKGATRLCRDAAVWLSPDLRLWRLMHRPGVIFLGLALLAFPSNAQADPVDAAPAKVVALDAGASALVGWATGLEPADAYNVYGIDDAGSPHILGTFVVADPQSSTTSVVVPSGFLTYGVSGVVETRESSITLADAAPGCIYIKPPYVAFNCDPTPSLPIAPVVAPPSPDDVVSRVFS